MHYLDRHDTEAPTCLDQYSHHSDLWRGVCASCKKTIRQKLGEMQGTSRNGETSGSRCAYCEGPVYNDSHIDHFFPKGDSKYRHLMFSWKNMFLSCGSNKHCGHYKKKNDTEGTIKPDEDDPDEFLYFHSSGVVRVREGLPEEHRLKACKTISMFGLNHGALQAKRKSAVEPYKRSLLADLDVIASWDEGERRQYLNQEVENIRWEPYATTLKHFLLCRA